ncbi:MAG TPA: FIST N-terminal domain-containing protein [Pseudonocardia sp.]|uniref:FIST signal transduction protein n=1 Tax=Pseudonocardia sp. TaxID=60912 RepID=UPI002BD050E5|nr:FIST N-terminal domain-containing protein [Pseudonocardia sp.]HTF49178.1 FIST N-terminal domain-containing protein [Pseudonocardia sp.]
MTDVGDGLATGTDLVAAAGSAVGQALERLGGRRPDLLCVFVCGGNPETIVDAGATAVKIADAGTAIGCSAGGVIGAGRGVEQVDAVAVWAAVLPGVDVRPIHLSAHRVGDALLVSGLPPRTCENEVGVLLADPYGFPVVPFVAHCNDTRPGLPLVGGLASGPVGPGSAKLFLDGVVRGGAVGVLLSGPIVGRIAVSQGCRPIGPPMTVTKAEGNMLVELAGMPADRKLRQILAALPPEEQAMVLRGLHLGVAMNEYAETHERGDFLIRGVLGADEHTGALVVGDTVDVGTTVRFQVRDGAAADEDLCEMLARLGESGDSKGALLFSCNGRGRAMFPSADHDVIAVRQTLGLDAVAGFFAAGEIGPVAGRNHVHGFTASILAVGSAPGIG